MSEPTINEALRQHVTSTGFNLMLGKSHIATLVALDKMLAANRHADTRRHELRLFVPAAQGLERRGLITHTMPKDGKTPVRRIWKITPAGRHVIGLLKDAGLYAEYADLIYFYPERTA